MQEAGVLLEEDPADSNGTWLPPALDKAASCMGAMHLRETALRWTLIISNTCHATDYSRFGRAPMSTIERKKRTNRAIKVLKSAGNQVRLMCGRSSCPL